MTEPGYLQIESSHSVWLFDTERKRFLRTARGADLSSSVYTTEWEVYHDLEVDMERGAFTVALNAAHTRLLRSWRDTSAAPDATGEVVAVAADAT